MKKLFVLIMFLVSTLFVNAQDSTNKVRLNDVYLRGGYSYHSGLVGAEVVFNRLSLGGGWMPGRTKISNEKINTVCMQLSVYFDYTDVKSPYGSIGYATNAYQYENKDYTFSSENVISIIGGYRWLSNNLDLKMGVGVAGSRGNNFFTGEITAGIRLFHNKN